jgi:hypothetical protein
MRGSKPLVLDRDSGIAHDRPGFHHDRAVIWTRHDDGPIGAGFDERAQNMGEHGTATELMQHLWSRRAQP